MLDDLFKKIDAEINLLTNLKKRNSIRLQALANELDRRFNKVATFRTRGDFYAWIACDDNLPSPTASESDNLLYDEYKDKINKLMSGMVLFTPTTVICSRSGEETSDFVTVDGKYVSRSMLTDNDFYCDYCKEYHNTMNTDIYRTVGGGKICERASKNFYQRCPQCGLYEQSGRMRYSTRDCLCRECYAKLEKYRIKSYHDTPMLMGYEYDKETCKNVGVSMDNFKGYGIELEVDCGGENDVTSKDIIQLLNEEVYTMHDGSIGNGFEIITHPHTEEALYNMNWEETFKWLLNKGYRSHDVSTCGLHMHISRRLFKDNEAICKMMYFYEKFRNDVIKMSRRTTDRVERWAGFYSMPHRVTKSFIIDAFNAYNGAGHSSRYKCVNLTNRNTIEIRIMKGTLRLETFLATLDFIITVAKNSNEISWDDIDNQELWLKGLKVDTVDYLVSRKAFNKKTSRIVRNSEPSEQSIVISDDEIETIKFRLEEINKQCV